MASSSPVPAEVLAGFPDLTGSLLEGRYRVGHALGVGGMGAVFEAEHIRLGRKVALKVMRPMYMQYRHHVARFLQEARAASQIKHPNVVEILDVGETPEGTVYTVMELLDGEDLATVLRRQGRLPWPMAHDILVQVVRALEAAHEQGVIHRDVKPANCFLTRDKRGATIVKTVDFGIAKFYDDRQLDDEDPLTKTGEVIGTPAYMAPELSLGGAANVRTDIYSLGVLAYQMLTGERPFKGSTAVEMHLNQTTKPPPAPRSIEPSIPAGVEALVLQMVAVAPDKRPADMEEVARRLRALAPRARNTLPMLGSFSPAPAPPVARRLSRPEIGAVTSTVTVADSPRPAPSGPSPAIEPAPAHEDETTTVVDPSAPEDDWEDQTTTVVDSGAVKVANPSASRRSGRMQTMLAPEPPPGQRRRLQTMIADPEMSRRSSLMAQPGAPGAEGKQTLPMGSSSAEEQFVGGSTDVYAESTEWSSAPPSDPSVPVHRRSDPSVPIHRSGESSVPAQASTFALDATQITTPPIAVIDPKASTNSGVPWVMVSVVVLLLAAITGACIYWWPEIWAMLQGPTGQ